MTDTYILTILTAFIKVMHVCPRCTTSPLTAPEPQMNALISGSLLWETARTFPSVIHGQRKITHPGCTYSWKVPIHADFEALGLICNKREKMEATQVFNNEEDGLVNYSKNNHNN